VLTDVTGTGTRPHPVAEMKVIGGSRGGVSGGVNEGVGLGVGVSGRSSGSEGAFEGRSSGGCSSDGSVVEEVREAFAIEESGIGSERAMEGVRPAICRDKPCTKNYSENEHYVKHSEQPPQEYMAHSDPDIGR
jgi:hypothetical protein